MPNGEFAVFPERDFRYLPYEIIPVTMSIAGNFYTFFTPACGARFNSLNVGPCDATLQRQYTWFFTSMLVASVSCHLHAMCGRMTMGANQFTMKSEPPHPGPGAVFCDKYTVRLHICAQFLENVYTCFVKLVSY